MSKRQKVKLASGQTVRDGDRLIVTVAGRYDAEADCVVGSSGEPVWSSLSFTLTDDWYADAVTVVKVKRAKGGKP